MKTQSLHTLLLTALILLSFSVFGQMANYKSLYIYNFIKRIEWPSSEKTPGEFYLVVYGDQQTAEALQQIASTKKAGSRDIIVQQINDISEIINADIIYVGYSKRKDLEELAQLIHLSPVLLVTDFKNAKESDINLMETGDGLEFIIRPKSIRNKGLKLSDSLILLGKQEDD
jgi:hypothetical protein